ncbi:MAG TPA: DNA primase catalytic subunit PriS [Methanomicrobia archaeon]|nr:DNA primase catalytic subunit PriS [Methanomicrobia archaeon]
MNEKTKHFVARRFKAYYIAAAAKIRPPREFWQREWGFVLFDQHYPDKMVMRRHTALATETDFQSYLREYAPAHAYYSTAVYNDPTAEMAKKGWLGADLIFDLDADHIVSEADLSHYTYEELLALVKAETMKLLDFLTNDFGFADTELELAFSGSRGYHIHIATESVRGLGSRERREIVDYVMATGLEIKSFMVADTTEQEHTAEQPRKADMKLIPEGWGRRVHDGLLDFLHELAAMEDEQALQEIRTVGGLDRKKAQTILRIANDETVMHRIEKGQIPQFAKPIWTALTETVAKVVRVKSADRVDEPVTADIKRLIRLPGSLHGKSSLRANPLTVETFEDFDPLADAVVFTSKPVEICPLRDSTITLRGERYTIAKAEIESFPEFAAIYFLCRGAAELA